jgi:hypothetical protein
VFSDAASMTITESKKFSDEGVEDRGVAFAGTAD